MTISQNNDPSSHGEKQTPTSVQRTQILASSALEGFTVNIPPVGLDAHTKFMASLRPNGVKSKEETYFDALVEQKELGTELVGFEGDGDFEDLQARLVSVFGQDTFDRCLVGKIVYDADHVLIANEGAHYEVPNEQYVALLSDNPDIDRYRVRAFNTANQNAQPAMKRYQRMPIAIYSFVGEPLDNKDYLPKEFDDATRMKIYKQGTVVHEIAHSAYQFLLDSESRAVWADLNGKEDPLTAYVAKHDGRSIQGEEQFAEAVRLYATNKTYLEKKSSEIVRFIEQNIPSLRADSLVSV